MKPLHVPAPAPDRWLFVLALALLLWLPLPWGSNSGWAESLFGFAAAALLAAWCAGAALGRWRLEPGERARLGWSLALWLAWLGWIALQLVPLGPALLDHLSPQALAVHAEAGAAGAAPLHTLSIAPARTADAFILSLAYCAWYWLIVVLCWRSESRMRLVLGTLVVSGTVQAAYGSLMVLSGLEYGFFEAKRHYLGDATGTFVNRNHLAGYLALAAAAGIGLILADLRPRHADRTWRQVLADWIELLFSSKARVRICLVILATGLVLTRSRMGNLSFFASLSLCGLLFMLLRERQLAGKALILFLSLLTVDVAIVGQWFGLERVVSRIEETQLEEEGRFQLFQELPPVIDAYWRTGSGLGTFASAAAPERTPALAYPFDHAHSDYLEFLIETGVPGLVLLLALAGAHGVHAVAVIARRRRRWPAGVAYASLMALTAFAFHCALEFNLQIPANAASLVALLALAACVSSTSRRKSRESGVQGPGGNNELSYTTNEAGHIPVAGSGQ